MILSKIEKALNTIFSWFINGVLIIVPFLLTIFVISYITSIVKTVVGLGMSTYYILIIVFFILLIGRYTRNYFIDCFYKITEFFIYRIPFISWIYSSVKEVTTGIVNKKIKFNKPVLIFINAIKDTENDIKKIGFITNESLEKFDLLKNVVVFVPQSFSLSGEILLVPKKNVIPIKDYDGIDIYKFIATAGFFDDVLKKKIDK